MDFFKGLDGSLYPVSQIRRVGKARLARCLSEKAPTQTHIVYLESGETVEIDASEFARLRTSPLHFIPAHPDTYLLSTLESSDGNLDRIPVIAWAATSDLLLRPVILPDPSRITEEAQPILFPNGMVSHPGDQCYKTLSDWQARQRPVSTDVSA